VADHEVRLDTEAWQLEAFTDLWRYLRSYALPDRRVEDEARILAEVGEWIGAHVFGPVGAAMVKARPATIRVVVPTEPEQARSLMWLPLQLAHVAGRPLAVSGVTFVMQLGGDESPGDVTPIGDRLRILGLFSLPLGGQPLNLRQERHALVRQLSGIAAVDRAVDIRVLQYGVTRARLRDVLEEDEGWDIIHLSGHGAPGELLLETEDGSQDPVTSSDLADILDLAQERLKLVSVSACWSAAVAVAEQRQLLGLPLSDGEPGPLGQAALTAGTLANELAVRLGCAVLAMRYPVVDDFAISLTSKLYDLLANKGRALPRALGMALREVVGVPPSVEYPALSLATPALFGARAADLRLAAPRRARAQSYDPETLKMAGFPPQPDRFVGRTGVMARTTAALAQESRRAGIILCGMPGGGKTACALEIAYTHEHAFERLVWFKAPDQGRDIAGALTEFALTLESELPNFQMVHVLEDPARLATFLPQLTEVCEQRRALFVIDQIESLVTSDGQWRDDRWGQVIRAMCAHEGLGRVMLTSRQMPAGLGGRVQVEPVDALSLDEALLLARELPHLRGLMKAELAGVKPTVARSLAKRVLNIAQGHPKLLELADGQAADLRRISALVEAGGQAWQLAGGLPGGFFTTGQPQAADEDYLHLLATWTKTVADGLKAGDRDLFWFLCCLEENDRIRPVTEENWAGLWARLSRPGTPLKLDAGLKTLAAEGLISVQLGTPGQSRGTPRQSYEIHPGIAAGGRSQAGPAFQEAVDTELAAWWEPLAHHAREFAGQMPTSQMVVRAGMSAASYLLRLRQWQRAAMLLQQALFHDPSRAVAGAVLGALQLIAASLAGTPDEAAVDAMVARALEKIDPAAGERRMQAVLAAAVAGGDYRTASVAAGDLAGYAQDAGRLDEALTLSEEAIAYAQRAGLGPMSQLAAQGPRLEVLGAMGQDKDVLAEVQRLRAQMDTLPGASEQPEITDAWVIQEKLLRTGAAAAIRLGRWREALDMNAEIVASQQRRGASETEIAKTRFNDSASLIRLGRLSDALTLLQECRKVFELTRDIDGLSHVLGALADLEDKRGHGTVAIGLAQDALRYGYLAENLTNIEIMHHNLGNYLGSHAHQPDVALAHHMTAALIRALIGGRGQVNAIRGAAGDIRELNDTHLIPADVTKLCQRVAEVPGADLSRLLTTLAPDRRTVQHALQEQITRAQAMASAPPAPPSADLAAWDPVIAALVAAQAGDTEAAAALNDELTHYENSDWAALVGVLSSLRDGQNASDLLAGLDDIATAIASRAMAALDGRVTIATDLWPAMPLRWLAYDLIAAARTDARAAQRAQQSLDALAGDPELAALAHTFGQILGGDRDPSLPDQFEDSTCSALVTLILYHIGIHELDAR